MGANVLNSTLSNLQHCDSEKETEFEFCSVKQNTVEEFEFECSRCGKKINLMSSIPAVKATTRPTSAGRNFVTLSFLVIGQYFKDYPDYHKILGTLGLDTSVSLSDPYCWMDCTFRKKDRRRESAKSKNWSSSTWRKSPVRRLLSDSRPLQLRRYLPRCEDWQNNILRIASCFSSLANNA